MDRFVAFYYIFLWNERYNPILNSFNVHDLQYLVSICHSNILTNTLAFFFLFKTKTKRLPILYDLSYFKFKWFGIIFFFCFFSGHFRCFFFIVFFNYLETEFIFWIFASISKPCMIRVFGKHKQMVIKSLFIVIVNYPSVSQLLIIFFFIKKKVLLIH